MMLTTRPRAPFTSRTSGHCRCVIIAQPPQRFSHTRGARRVLALAAASDAAPAAAAANEAAAEAAAAANEATAAAPAAAPKARRYEVTLPKPLGVVFAARAANADSGGVFVESVVPGGNADRAGVKAGDVLVACSAVTLKAGKEGEFSRVGHGARPYDNFEVNMLDTENLAFSTVMSALKSNNERWGIKNVTIVISRAQ